MVSVTVPSATRVSSTVVAESSAIAEYLEETYGITVYQEQVMLLSQSLAGFTKGEADVLRKAMGKKKKDVLDKMKPKFIEQGNERGHDAAICCHANRKRHRNEIDVGLDVKIDFIGIWRHSVCFHNLVSVLGRGVL